MKWLWILLVIALCALVLGVASLCPLGSNETWLGVTLTVSTFLFGVFIAFSMSDRHNRIDKIRENDSTELGSLELLFHLSALHGEAAQESVKAALDRYLMATLDYYIWDFHRTEAHFQELLRAVTSLSVRDAKQASSFSQLLQLLTSIEAARKHTISLIDDRLSTFEWLVFCLLSAVILLSLVLINTGTAMSFLMTALVSLCVLLLLLLLYTLDSLAWKEQVRIWEPYQRTFEAIGLLRYYPGGVIRSGRIKVPRGQVYRVARYPNRYPDMTGKEVSVVGGS